MTALQDAPIFRKHGKVKARAAVAGERITTTLKDGTQETGNTAKEGDYVVTDLSGEQYILPPRKFLERYEPSEAEGVYRAIGYCRAIRNPFGQPIEIIASWGSPQIGDQNCFLADTCDESGKVQGEPYLIDAHAFSQAYRRVST
ncbi:MAG TPA: PGDYG domain-containing protein [Candidatus Angelobacter sp.]|nr:PGDYG domain-containing protein [Candidatus Angelobacter sp.]